MYTILKWLCSLTHTYQQTVHMYYVTSLQILQLLLQMKRASWVLKNTFHQLKVSKQLSPSQTRQLQVYRHEYQHFVNVMHGYIANQVFQITWREFEIDLENDVCNCVTTTVPTTCNYYYSSVLM